MFNSPTHNLKDFEGNDISYRFHLKFLCHMYGLAPNATIAVTKTEREQKRQNKTNWDSHALILMEAKRTVELYFSRA